MLEKSQINPEDESYKIEKISESSPEYDMEKRVNKDSHDSDNNLSYFGDIELARIKEVKKRAMSVEDRLNMLPLALQSQMFRDLYESKKINQSEADRLIHESIIESLDFFNNLLLDKDHIKSTENIFDEAIDNPKIKAMIMEEANKIDKDILKKIKEINKKRKYILNGPTDSTVNRLMTEINPNWESSVVEPLIALIYTKKISDQLWIDILENHKALFLKKSVEFKKNILPKLMKEFQDTINIAIDQEELPLDKELVKKRIEPLDITLMDELYASFERIGGSFVIETDTINISPSVISFFSQEKIKHVLFHEMFHALSGRLIVKEIESGDIHHERIGLNFDIKRDDLEINIELFRWLNEAVTTFLEEKFLSIAEKKPQPSWAYKQERELLNLIMSGGKEPIDEKLFINAYFENLDPNLPSKDRLPAWEALTKQISLSWEQGFLNHVDNLIKEKGIKETIVIIKEMALLKNIML